MRKSYTAEFKSKVALEAVKEESTISEIASKYEIHPNMVINWKRQFIENASKLWFSSRMYGTSEFSHSLNIHIFEELST